jgi:hypothetical protein
MMCAFGMLQTWPHRGRTQTGCVASKSQTAPPGELPLSATPEIRIFGGFVHQRRAASACTSPQRNPLQSRLDVTIPERLLAVNDARSTATFVRV